MPNETRKVYYSDIAEKKKTSYGSKHKKNGSKSHYVHFEHENLTESEWQKMNGPVITYKVNLPLTYSLFKAMPLDLQREHVKFVKTNYGPTIPMFAHTLGVTPPTLRKILVAFGLNNGWPLKVQNSVRDRYERWSNGEELPKLADIRAETDLEPESEPDTESQEEIPIAQTELVTAPQVDRVAVRKVNGLERLEATYNLNGDPQPAVDLLQYIVWKEGKYTCHIILEKQLDDAI